MTLFLSVLAGSVIVAVVLWKLGRNTIEAQDPYKIGALVFSVLWVLLGAAQIHAAWTALSDVVAGLLSGDPVDLAAQASKIDDARFHLIIATMTTVLWAIALIMAIRTTRKAFESRTAEKAAQIQETHA